jgi:hypothetical protein
MNFIKLVTCILLTFFISTISSAQDIIVTFNGEEIKSKVMEVSINEIKYKKFENINGPLYGILKSSVLMIKYENGSKDVFSNINNNNTNYTSQIINLNKNKNQVLFGVGLGIGKAFMANLYENENRTIGNTKGIVKFNQTVNVNFPIYYNINNKISFLTGISTFFSKYTIQNTTTYSTSTISPSLLIIDIPFDFSYKFKFKKSIIQVFGGPNLSFVGWTFSRGIFDGGATYNVIDYGVNLGVRYPINKSMSIKMQFISDAFTRKLESFYYNGYGWYYLINKENYYGKRNFTILSLEYIINK